MQRSPPESPLSLPQANTPDSPLHRSGAVARMLRMPVATLRIWERRYRLTQPQLSASGQRLYANEDVRRLALIKQLTDLGHAIGSLAPLDMAGLQSVAATHAQALAASRPEQTAVAVPAALVRPWRLAVVGAALGTRLERPALRRRLAQPVQRLGPFDDLAQAAAALQASDVDAVLIHQPHLNDGWMAHIDAAAPALAAVPRAVLYAFAADAVCETLADAGAALLREPQPDAVLAQWLNSMAAMHSAAAQPTPNPAGSAAALEETPMATEPLPPRRWDDAALAGFAGLSSTIACECPRHVAELLVQLSHFEAYSAECEHRSSEDAQLHAYLRRVAAVSRARFEAALEHVALHEGLMLPPAASVAPAGSASAVAAAAAKRAHQAQTLGAARPRQRT